MRFYPKRTKMVVIERNYFSNVRRALNKIKIIIQIVLTLFFAWKASILLKQLHYFSESHCLVFNSCIFPHFVSLYNKVISYCMTRNLTIILVSIILSSCTSNSPSTRGFIRSIISQSFKFTLSHSCSVPFQLRFQIFFIINNICNLQL